MIDLAAMRLGGLVLAASDEFFAPKERLLAPEDPAALAGYTDRGKRMDGWETRRRRTPGHDWAVVRLGVPGIVREVVVDTRNFRGNQPEACEVDACNAIGAPLAPLLPRTALDPDREHRLTVTRPVRATHVRLVIHPDGGVARLRVHGEPLPDLRRLGDPIGDPIDVASAAAGGMVEAASNAQFSPPSNLLLPGGARDMGDGWETRRRRGPGHDWVTVRLAAEAVIDRVELDTTHFVGNYPESCALAVYDPAGWVTLVERSPLRPHATHVFPVAGAPPATRARLEIHPDGGVARLRLFGRVTDRGWREAGVRLLDALPAAEAEAELLACCGSPRWAAEVAARRPVGGFDRLLAAADEVWAKLQPVDWEAALAAHPKIGERASGWSADEQRAAGDTDFAEANRAYEARFGRTFVVRAAGRSGEEMLEALRDRLANDPDTELRTAAEQQRQITGLRLERMMRP